LPVNRRDQRIDHIETKFRHECRPAIGFAAAQQVERFAAEAQDVITLRAARRSSRIKATRYPLVLPRFFGGGSISSLATARDSRQLLRRDKRLRESVTTS
jgi:hypothetical protein